MPRCLAIDFGLERTGLAISDPEGRLAFPLKTLHLSAYPSRKALLDDLAHIIDQSKAEEIIIGLPLETDGKEGLACRQIRKMAQRLERRIQLHPHFVSEELSTYEANERLKSAGIKKAKSGAIMDQQAACIILESFLASNKQRRPA